MPVETLEKCLDLKEFKTFFWELCIMIIKGSALTVIC